MQQSPTMSARRRRSSGFSSISSFHRPMHSRKSSMQSLNSPHTPYRPPSALDRNGEFGFGINAFVPEGLDNLAAELAEEDWDEDDEMEESIIHQHGDTVPNTYTSATMNGLGLTNGLDGSPLGQQQQRDQHDAAVHSEDEDIHPDKIITADLEQQLKAIETLAKQNTRESSRGQDAFDRVGEQLRDLNSQLKVEEQATKLANTADTVSMHLYEGDRYLKTILQTYLSPFAPLPDLELVEALQPMFEDLISSIPATLSTPLPAIRTLATSGNDILTSLATLSDNVYIAQQQASRATQKLRSVQDIVDTIRRELRTSETGLEFLQNGDCYNKLHRREAASVCDDVLNGFEQVCESWRRRLGGSSGESLAMLG